MAAPAGSIWEVSFRATVCGQRCINVMHYISTVEAGTADIVVESEDLADAIAANVGVDYLPCLAQNCNLDEIVVQCIKDTLGVRFARFVLEQDEPGLFPQDTLTANVSAVITKRTQFAGRWAVGSWHMPGVPDTTFQNGMLTSIPYKAALAVLAQELTESQTTVLGGEYQPVIYHPDGLHGGSTEIKSAEVQEEVRVMRRRTVGRGI